ncbi:MAG TPA: UpxY family transcription antiterminator [Parafilimonas sp.]|jgi:transcription antitermination factor NusG|nr:UpxY family transcription antiterminator [Parafilimonas sp.]
MAENLKNWFALYTKPRWEKKINTKLLNKGIESWCPVQKLQRQWSDRKKIIEDPLFKSYVFVHISDEEKAKVLNTEGVIQFVYYLKKPAIIRDEEIQLIKTYLLEKDVQITVQNLKQFEEKDLVVISKGVFMDNEGVVVRGGKRKIYVRLESLDQLMTVEFPADHLQHKHIM